MSNHFFEADAKMIIDTVLSIHPKIDWKNPQSLIDEASKAFIKSSKTCEFASGFFDLAQRFFKSISDAHTTIQKPEYIFRQPPISLEEVENQIIIDDFLETENTLTKGISINDRLIVIDGIEIEEAITRIMEKEVYNVEQYGRMLAIRQILQTKQNQDKVALTCIDQNHNMQVIHHPVFDLDDKKVSSWYIEKQRKEMIDAIKIDIFDDVKSGYLKYSKCKDRTIPTFVAQAETIGILKESLPQMDEVCDQLFFRMNQKGYKHLILDLRDNEGGDAILGYEIIKRITNKPILSYGSYCRVSERLKTVFHKTIQHYSESYQKTIKHILDTETNQILTFDRPLLFHPYKGSMPQYFNYECQVFVLINHKVYSSGEWLAVELKDNQLATFIGTPTGGGGSVPGDTLTFRTPNGKMLFDVSYRYFFRPDLSVDKDQSVIPNDIIEQTLKDKKQNRDTVLEFTKKIIQNLIT